MECSCAIDVDIGDYEYEELRSVTTMDKRNLKCCECSEVIHSGTQHRLDVMKANWHYPPKIDVLRTCLDCFSVRSEVFCDFQFGTMWEQLDNFLQDGGLIPEGCIANLTPRVREMVCDAIEENWEDEEEDDGT
jgi:hypothetical protein